MRNSNRKGGAAIVAVLVMIIIVAVGCALMVVTGRKTIMPNESVASPMPAGYDDRETTMEETTAEEEAAAPEELITPMLPTIADSYETINLKDSTFSTAVLLDASSNEILAGYKYDQKVYPASLTKLMTLLVAVENIDDMQAKYKFTKDDLKTIEEENASVAGFVAGDEVTMEDLLYAAILPSGADGTLGLANAISGSEKDFVRLMNNKVTQLGLTDTYFVNASGLHDKQHYSTAQDMAVIAKACMDNETCRKVLCAETWTTKPTKEFEEGIELESIFHGRFNGYFIDADQDGVADADLLGGKTGFTDEAMYTLVTVIKYEGREYICVTNKSDNTWDSTGDAILVFENYLPGAVGTPVVEDDSSEEDEDAIAAEGTVITITDKTDSSSKAEDDDSENEEDPEA